MYAIAGSTIRAKRILVALAFEDINVLVQLTQLTGVLASLFKGKH